MSVGDVTPNGNPTLDCKGENTYPIYAAKYGTATDPTGTTINWGWQTLKRMTAWGFNSVGQDSSGNVMPFQTCSNCDWPGGKQPIPVPYLMVPKPAEYASMDRFGYLNSPIKDEIYGTNAAYTAWRGGALFDVFDPNLNVEWQNELANASDVNTRMKNNDPYILGIFTDDSDYFTGFGDGPEFVVNDTNANLGFVTLITSPVQTFNTSTSFGGKTVLYPQSQVYSKAQATNPAHGACSISNPCSLRDYLYDKYSGNISALNAAWGSNYTTFDSTGTHIAGELVGTGNGSQKTFSYTLAHSPISPMSILISVSGAAQIGDCPWFSWLCGGAANTGILKSPTSNYVSSSSINYSTGTVTLNFATPPASGAPITVSYIYGGWMAGGTGLMDESGANPWVGTNNFCLQTNATTYFVCTGARNYKPKPNANPTLGADVDNWIPQFSAKYFKTMHDDFKGTAPCVIGNCWPGSELPYLGVDNFGEYAYSKVLQGAAPYLDGAYVGLFAWAPEASLQPKEFQAAYQHLTKHLGDIPLLDFAIVTAQADSSYSCNPAGLIDQGTQAARGQAWYNTVTYLLSTPSANGTYPFVGFDWWSWQDFQGINQGLVSLRDNAYDGHEDVSGTVSCSSPLGSLSCGGEQGNYGDAITPIRAATGYWLTGMSGSGGTAPASTQGGGTPLPTQRKPVPSQTTPTWGALR